MLRRFVQLLLSMKIESLCGGKIKCPLPKLIELGIQDRFGPFWGYRGLLTNGVTGSELDQIGERAFYFPAAQQLYLHTQKELNGSPQHTSYHFICLLNVPSIFSALENDFVAVWAEGILFSLK